MEDHLTNKDRLQKEWDTLCAYDAEPCSVVAAIEPTNMRKNRFTDILPCMHYFFMDHPRSGVLSLFHEKHGSDRVEETNKQTTKQLHRQINK